MTRLVLRLTLVALAAVPSGARAGAWTQPAGELWVKVSGFTQDSDEFIAREAAVLPDGTAIEAGDVRPFDDGGRTLSRQVWFDLEYGVTDRVTLGVKIPWKRLEYEDRIETIRSWGWGDLTSSLRVAALTGPTRLTLIGQVDHPTGRFSTRTDRLPIGNGQTDYALGLQVGRSLGRPLTWINVDLLRRFRGTVEELDFEPGDEWAGALESGVGLDGDGRFGVALRWSFQRGDDTSLLFVAPNTALARDVDQIDATVMGSAGPVFVEIGWSRIIRGEGFPSRPTWSLGVSTRLPLHRTGS